MVVSAVMHGAVVAAVVLWPTPTPPARPPVYKVNLVGAPPGPKNIGVVQPPTAAEVPAAQAEAPAGLERPPEQPVAPTETAAPAPPVAKATPTPAKSTKPGEADAPKTTARTAAPKAGSETGGKGADVVTVKTDGIEFPSPGYLNNIIRQVEVRFKPDTRFENRPLKAEVSFLIHRDGHVSEIRVEQGSGEYRFDLDARSAVEAAGSAKAFGPLPPEWTDDVLRVYFNFSPKGMR